MSQLQLCITKPDFVLKTFMDGNSKNSMKNRYASAIIIVLKGCITFYFSSDASALNNMTANKHTSTILNSNATAPEFITSITLENSSALFVSEGSDYNIYCHEDAESLIINFHTIPLTDTKFFASKLGSINSHTALLLFDRLNLLLQYPVKNHDEIFAIYYQLLTLSSNVQSSSDSSNALVEMAEKLIWEGYASTGISCSNIAHSLNISEVYLRKLFLRYRHLPPSKYLLRIRMEKARQFILEGCSVSDAAENTGYSDIYQFSRAYKKYYGVSPSKH